MFALFDVPSLARQPIIAEHSVFWGGPVEFSPDGTMLATRLNSGSALWRTSDLSVGPLFPQASQRFAFLGNGMLTLLDGWAYEHAQRAPRRVRDAGLAGHFARRETGSHRRGAEQPVVRPADRARYRRWKAESPTTRTAF